MSQASQILEDVKSGKCTIDEAQKMLAQLTIKPATTYKVSPKGAISFYGIRRMPITVYYQELEQILDVVKSQEFAQFLSENKGKLSVKEKK